MHSASCVGTTPSEVAPEQNEGAVLASLGGGSGFVCGCLQRAARWMPETGRGQLGQGLQET